MDQAPKPGSSSDMFRESICSVCYNRPDHRLKKEFTIQVKPNKGAVVIVNRATPPELKAIMELN